MPGFAVFEYLHDGNQPWYRIRMVGTDTYGWLTEHPEFEFHGITSLVTNSLSYLTSAWDKRVYSDPRKLESASILDVAGEEIPIEVASSANIDGNLWLLVVVLSESQCSSAYPAAVVGSGWVPVASSSGKLNTWFYSRGC